MAPEIFRPRRATLLRVMAGPISVQAWRDTRFVAAGLPVQLAALLILVLPVLVIPARKIFLILLVVALVSVLVAVVPLLTAIQRHRFRDLLGIDIPSTPRPGPVLDDDPAASAWLSLRAWASSEATWRQLGYHVVVAPVLAAGALLTVSLWAAGAGLAGIFGYVWIFPMSSSMRSTGYTTRDTSLTVLGVLLLLAAPWAAAMVTRLDIRAAAALLGPNRATVLERRVEHLTESRAGVVDAADAERRRIERDLHDGAQQRLVSLAMNLGMARARLTDLPDDARQAIDEAHEEAKEALAELRNLVRGLHPAVLEDRGLDAALSGIAARAPLPVRLEVDVRRRPTPTVEAVAYFVVSEALANIARHAQASAASITVQRLGDVLWVVVTDDGAGGADPARGTGLAGLARRARSVDGTFSLSSPAGGPTRITVELPCAS